MQQQQARWWTTWTSSAAVLTLALAALNPFAAHAAQPEGAAPAAIHADGAARRVSEFVFQYREGAPTAPSLHYIRMAPVKLARTAEGIVAWREGLEAIDTRLDRLDRLPDPRFHDSALQAIAAATQIEFSRRSLAGVTASVTLQPLTGGQAGDAQRAVIVIDVPGGGAAGDGPAYPVSRLEARYTDLRYALPPVAPMMEATVTLAITETGLAPWREGFDAVTLPLASVNQLSGVMIHRSALDVMRQALVTEMNKRGYVGFSIAVSASDIADDARDLRAAGDNVLTLEITPSFGESARVDGGRYGVMVLELAYRDYQPWMPDPQPMLNAPVELAATEGGYVPWEKGMEHPTRLKLVQIGQLPDFMMYASTIQLFCRAVEQEFRKHGYAGASVDVAPGQIGEDGTDLRGRGNYTLRLLVDASKLKSTADRVLASDGGAYPVAGVALQYAKPRDGLPPVENYADAEVTLGETEKGYVAYRPGLVPRTMKVSEIGAAGEAPMHASAIRSVSQSIVQRLNRDNYVGVAVTPAQGQFDENGSDLRSGEKKVVTLDVAPGVVTDVRTIASGDRVAENEKLNSSVHERIRAASPIVDSSGRSGVLRRDDLDQYVYWLNRHPGRRVDAALSPGREPGTFALDYLVQEGKPWTVYAQVSNTGTAQTDEWRERFGFVHHQLTGNDDVLRLDYVTAGFESSHAFIGSYEAPVPTLERLRWGVNGTWSNYVASDVGQFSQKFEGESWSFGGSLNFNIYQYNEFFIDLFGALTYQRITTEEEVTQFESADSFLRPEFGVKAERVRPIDATFAGVTLETNLSEIAGTSDASTLPNASKLGRNFVDNDWWSVRWEITHSFYIEPLLRGAKGPQIYAPETSTLAHEILISARGQYVLGDARVIPQYQMTLGGLYTVRGYDESAAVGDNAGFITAEYRFHVPRIFAVNPEPPSMFGRPFRWSPQTPQGRPDWDLILKAFVDYGRTSNNEPRSFETDEQLFGAGVGFDLQVLQNFNLRVDWGTALKDVEGVTESGTSRVHILGTVLY